MIDLHSHILPGLDDGSHDLDESLAIARSMVEDGVTVVAATPHVRDDYPTTPEAMSDALNRVQEAVADAGIALDVRPGGEIALDWLDRLEPETLACFGLGGNPSLALVEYPYYGRPLFLARQCELLRLRGIVPVIAHPERSQVVQEKPWVLEEVVNEGAVIQLTAASLDGRLGRRVSACARALLDRELAHLVASDAHSPGVREAGLSAAAAAVGGGALADWLTQQVPEALLAGEALPARPPGKRPRSRLLRRIRG